jgi:enoyl-CoA hydratase
VTEEYLEGIRLERRGRVATITIDRPERRNAISSGVADRLTRLFVELDEDPDVWAIGLTGAGDKAFCAGADLKEADEQARGEGYRPPAQMRSVERNLFEVILETGKPTVAIINGVALGGGLELALACDIRLVAAHAVLAMPEAKRGMGANFGSVWLPRLIPRAIALEMLYTGEPLPLEDARAYGLVNRVVPFAELHERAAALLDAIVANAPLTVQRFKQMTLKGESLSVHAALRLNVGPNPYASRDREEGARAFVEKRAPRWEGR